MQGIYATSAFLDSTCFSVLYSDSNATGDRQPAATSAYHDYHQDQDLQKPTPSSHNPHLYASQIRQRIKLKADQVRGLLSRELEGNRFAVSSQLIDLVFPSKSLPFLVDDNLLKQLQWTKPDEKGVNSPGVWTGHKFRDTLKEFTEKELGDWMNRLAQAMSDATGKTLLRSWSHTPSGVGGLVLLDTAYLSRIQHTSALTGLPFVRAMAEVTSEKTTPSQMHNNVVTKSYLSFQHQPARRFTISLSFNGNGEMALTLVDREGLLQISKVTLMQGGRVQALMFLKTLAVLVFGTEADIGLDPNYEVDAVTGKVMAIVVDEKRFEVEKRVHSPNSLLGRGTQVWVVKRNGERFTLKDSWIQVDRVESEERFLTAISASQHDAIKNSVPTLICGGNVIINGILDCTSHYREGLVQSRKRVHRRIVCSPVGEILTGFRSKKEFISAMMDVIRAHHYLYNELGILHRDISFNNILLHRFDAHETTGLLIDFDHGEFIDFDDTASVSSISAIDDAALSPVHAVGNAGTGADSNTVANTHYKNIRTGTPPFMAIEALTCIDPHFNHMPCHDLESILYVIVYVCTITSGPNSILPESQLSKNLAVRSWFVGINMRSIGSDKIGHMELADRNILPGFSEYWADFAPFVLKLIKACFPHKASVRNSLNYKQMLDILSCARDVVQEPLGSSQVGVGQKRPSQSMDSPRSKRGRRLMQRVD